MVGQFPVFLLPTLEKVVLILSPEADYPEVFVVFLRPSKKMLITMVSSPTIEHCVTYTIDTDMAATNIVGWVPPDKQNTKNLFGFLCNRFHPSYRRQYSGSQL
jgi:hypothetical protein